MNLVEIIKKHNPAGASIKQFMHYGQFIHGEGVFFNHFDESPSFRNYDYGTIGNLERYGSSTPPDWDLSKIKVPVTLLAGTKDELATKKNTEYLISKLTNALDLTVNYIENYGHTTWMYAKDGSMFLPIIDKAMDKDAGRV